MKNYMKPTFEVVVMSTSDVITVSGYGVEASWDQGQEIEVQ